MQSTSTGACFGNDATRTHRYTLWRAWSNAPRIVAVMLNPSTADERVLDPTLTRVQGYARAWGFGGFIIGNAFALRATNPKELLPNPIEAIGKENDSHLKSLAAMADSENPIIVGWGTNLDNRKLRFRMIALQRTLGDNVACWDTTQSGQPVHPLYQPASKMRREFTWPT